MRSLRLGELVSWIKKCFSFMRQQTGLLRVRPRPWSSSAAQRKLRATCEREGVAPGETSRLEPIGVFRWQCGAAFWPLGAQCCVRLLCAGRSLAPVHLFCLVGRNMTTNGHPSRGSLWLFTASWPSGKTGRPGWPAARERKNRAAQAKLVRS